MLGCVLGRKPRGLRLSRCDLCSRGRRPRAGGQEPADPQYRRGQDERAGARARCPGDALQLAGLPRDLDLGADDQRHREVHRDLLVRLCLHWQRLRTFGRQYDLAVDRFACRASADGHARRLGLEPALGDDRQRDQRRRHCRSRLLDRLTAAGGSRRDAAASEG